MDRARDVTEHRGPDQLFPSSDMITWLADQAVKLRADDRDILSKPPVSVVTAFKTVAEEYPNKIAIVDNGADSKDDVYTYKRYYESVVQVAKAFIKLGLETYRGVGIMGSNAPQWMISYLAAIFAGGLAAGIHPSESDHSKKYLISLADCNVIVVEEDIQLQFLLKALDDLPHLKAIIQYKGKPILRMRRVYSWDEILEMNVDDCEEEFERRIMNMAPNKCCTILCTSGTTGKPKLVMRSHDNMVFEMKTLLHYVNEGQIFPPDTVLSYIPLSNAAGVMMDIYWTLISGGTTYIAKPYAPKESLIQSLREVRPTVFFGVPRVWEMLMEAAVNPEKVICKKPLDASRTKLQKCSIYGDEILIDGRHIFMGYLNDMTTTKEVFDEEFWFRTGDLGRQDDDGFITVTGRVKEIIIPSDGENIAPVPIENRVLEELPCLRYCILIGEQKRFLSMLMTFKSKDETSGKPNDYLEHSALQWCRSLGSNATKVSEILTSQDPLIMDAIQKGIDKANANALTRTQCIQKWMILPHDFSEFGGELGPTLKMKRHEIYKIYWREIGSFY